MYWNQDYLETFYPQPSGDISPDKKQNDPEYSLGVAKYIYGYGYKYGSGVEAYREKCILNRQYGRGDQPVEAYQDMLDPEEAIYTLTTNSDGTTSYHDSGETERKGYGNIDWTIYPILSKYKSIFVGRMSNRKFDISAQSIDLKTNTTKEKKKKQVWINKILMDRNPALLMKLKKKPEFIPNSKEELELVYSGEKLDYEMAIEQAIKNDFIQSDWDEVQTKLHEDVFDINECATWVKFDTNTHRTTIEYLDVAELIIQYSSYRDHRNASFAGIPKDYTINEFRKENPDMKEEDIRELASRFNGVYGNNSEDELTVFSRDNYKREGYDCNYNNFIIPTLFCVWTTIDKNTEKIDAEYEIKGDVKPYELKKGKVIKRDGKYYKTKKSKRVKNKVQMTYQCKWVIGSEYVWDYGIMPYQIRQGSNAFLPVRKYRGDGQSLNERCQRIVDDIQINHFRFQNAQAFAGNNGYVFDYDSAVATANEIKGMQPVDLIKLRRRGSGDILLKFKPDAHFDFLNRGGGTNGLPIQELKGGLQNQLLEYIQLYNQKIMELRFITGLSEEMVGESSTGDDTATQAQIRAMASEDALQQFYLISDRILEKTGETMAMRIQKMIAYNKKSADAYAKAIGQQFVDAIKKLETWKTDYTQWGLNLDPLPTAQQKEKIAMKIEIALKEGRIELSDSFMLEEYLENGTSIKVIRKALLMREKYNAQKRMEEQQAAIKGQGDQIKQQQQEALKLEAQKEQMKTGLSIKETTVEKNLDLRNEMELMRVELLGAIQKIVAKGEADKEVQAAKPEVTKQS